MKKLLIGFLVGVFVMIVLGHCLIQSKAEAAAKTFLVFTTGGIGGTWYPIGSGISSFITKNVEGINIAAQSSGGGVENVNLVNSDQADIGLVPSAPGYQAYRGIPPFKQAFKKMVGIGMTNKNPKTVYALKKSGLKTIMDLRGKRVNAGPAGTAMAFNLEKILEGHGMSMQDIKPVYLPYRDAVEAIKDGRIDAAIEDSGLPAPAILDVSSVHDVVLLEFEPSAIEKLIKLNPYYVKFRIPKGTYRGIDRDLNVVTDGSIIMCRVGLPEDVVYRITKAIYSKECLEYLSKIHQAAREITLEEGLNGMIMPVHPGAAKFWKEVGLYDAWEKQKLYQ